MKRLWDWMRRPGKCQDEAVSVVIEQMQGMDEELLALSRVKLGKSRRDVVSFEGKGLWVLIIDDNEEFREILKGFLEKKGAEVACARDGKEGLEMYLEYPGRYGVILLDIHMPVMDGYEVASRLRASGHEKVPILVTSGEERLTQDEKAIFTRCMKKPFDLEEMAVIIDRVVGGG